jgi:hypothetical protein
MIEQLIAALLSSNNDLDWRDLADVLWLVQTSTAGVSTQQVADIKSGDTATWPAQPDAGNPPSVPVVDPVERPAADQAVMIRRGTTNDPASDGYRVKPLGWFALPGQLEIARALRPLKHRRRSLRDSSFDVDATVEHYCDTGLLVPIMKPSQERWFRDLALVSDGGPTMVVWDETIAALATLFEREGGFDRVSRWTMTGDTREISLSSPNRLPHPPEQLIDDDGRRLIIVVTDCVGSPWRGPAAWAALRNWGRCCPVALVQMLPPRLWPATALGSTEVLLSSHRRGAPNRLLRLRSPWWWDADEPPQDGIPVVTLDEDQLGAWARMVMGAGGIEVSGVVAAAPGREALVEVGTAQVPAATRVATFRSTVSSEASQLATLLSAVDVTLPVARLILNGCIADARQTYLAEVLASGLLEPSGAVGEQAYDFAPGVRELLQESLTATSFFDVWRTVGPYIESAMPGSPSLSIVLDRNAEIPADQGSAMSKIALQVAERLGLRKPNVSQSSADGRTGPVENVPAPSPFLAPRISRGAPLPGSQPPTATMTDTAGLPYYEVDFNADGSLNTASGGGDGGLPAAVEAGEITDLFVFAHGWNNGVDSARDLYQAMFGLLADQLGRHCATSAAVGVIWPSLLFPDDDPATAPPVPSNGAQLAAALAPAFPGQQQSLATLGALLDEQPPDLEKLRQFHAMATELVTTEPQGAEDAGEGAWLTGDVSTVLGRAAAMVPAAARAPAGVGDPFTGLWSGAREVLRTLSYYEMKNRAGVVGQHGLGPLLAGLHGPAGPPRIHLIGHSYGARLAAYTLAGIPAENPSRIKMLFLIQGTFSHFAFAHHLLFDPSRSGALASFANRVDGPLLATFSSFDRVLGWWYPAACMLTGEDDLSAADLVYKWAAMGHDGYQQHPTPTVTTLDAPGTRYDFRPGVFYNLHANSAIYANQSPITGAHTDIRHPEVLWAIVSAANLRDTAGRQPRR